jgi:hypothetical protein
MVKDLNIRFSGVCVVFGFSNNWRTSGVCETYFFFSELQKKNADFKHNIAWQVNTAS